MTVEETLREAVADHLTQIPAIADSGVKVVTRIRGDIAAAIDEALASVGTVVVVTTPIPTAAADKHSKPQYTGYSLAVLTIANPMLSPNAPSDAALACAIEEALHQFAPAGVKLGSANTPWVLRIDAENPREDVSEDVMTSRLLSRFKYKPKGSA